MKTAKYRSLNPISDTIAQHLYVMSRSDRTDIFKVGRSNDPAVRARYLGEGHCFVVECLMSFDGAGIHEAEVHRQLASYRVIQGNGKEWFKCSLDHIHNTIKSVINSNSASSSSDHAALP